MSDGVVEAIFIAPEAEASPQAVDEVRAVKGRGLEGDRYFAQRGTWSKTDGSGRQVTFIEAEALEAAASDYDVALDGGRSRRNVVTRGVALNHLVGSEFRVGDVVLRGTRLCEPCQHMERLSGQPGARKALVHRGGLRAEIVSGGTIRVGDRVESADG